MNDLPNDNPDPMTERAILGGGCFWCLEAVFIRLEGVRGVRSGYAGGWKENPGYREVCSGSTGHAEVVEVVFDPEVIGYEELLRVFFTIHDPTTVDRQGNDVGSQYRSIIFTLSDEQEAAARRVMASLTADGPWDDPIVTAVEPLQRFWPAEPEHHRYFERNPTQGYCSVVVAPKVAKARASFAHRFRETPLPP